jgi:hypothetical protein
MINDGLMSGKAIAGLKVFDDHKPPEFLSRPFNWCPKTEKGKRFGVYRIPASIFMSKPGSGDHR